jgi:hypothetical protein
LRQPSAPRLADDHQSVCLADRSLLQRREAGVGEVVDVVDGADEGWDQPVALQRRQRVAGDSVVRVIEVEAPVLRTTQPCDIIGDPMLDHRQGVGRRRRYGEGDGAAARRSKEAGAVRVGRVQNGLAAERPQRFAEIHRVDDAAPRVGRMRQHRHAQGPAHDSLLPPPNPIRRSTAKSHNRADRPPERSVTSAPSRTAPIFLALSPRA